MADTGGEDNKGGQSTAVVSHIKSSRMPSKKVLTIIGVIIVLMLAVGAGAAFRWMQNKNAANDPNGGLKGAQNQTASGLEPAIDEIQNLRLQGKEEEAQKKIDEALRADSGSGSNSSTSDSTKYLLYIQQGNGLLEKQDFKGAISSYEKAYAIKASFEATTLLADTWEQAGDKPKAIEYYKKALPIIPKTPVYDDEKASIEQKITQLGG